MAQGQSRGSYGADRYENYVPVVERIEQFYAKFPEGKILTSIIEHDREQGFVLVRAEVYRHANDTLPAATGHAYEYRDSGYTQKTSYIEVGETSAVGRALAFLGFETKRGIASREEIEKFARMSAVDEAAAIQTAPAASTRAGAPSATTSASQTSHAPHQTAAHQSAASATSAEPSATDTQKKEILARLEMLYPNDRRAQRQFLEERTGKRSRDDLTQDEARRFIAELKKQ
jgi:hypothetical protein